MKNKTKIKKASNKAHQTFLTHSTSQPTDSQEVYQGNFESEVADSGRSMVEMLGVLAVVGVLSVGGILGYKYAMTKYQANQIVNELNLTSSQMAIMLMRPHSADFELSLGEPYDDGHIATNALAFNFGCGAGAAEEDANCASDDIEYFSEVQNLPKEVCQNLVQLAQNLPYLEEVLVNNTTDTTGTSCAENNTVRCLFNADKNTLIDDNPDPEVTETETDDGLECSGHGKLQSNGYCKCDGYYVNGDGWYDSNNGGHYSEDKAKNCALSQTTANQKFCNGKGTWAVCGCDCNNGTSDDSNNYCRDNGGCCKDVKTITTTSRASTTTTIKTTTTVATTTKTGTETTSTTTTTTTPETTTPETTTPEVTLSGISCGVNAYWDEYMGKCYCEDGWYTANGFYFEIGTADCLMSQAEANEQYCNNQGKWTVLEIGGQGCKCSNGTPDSSNNNCRDNGGCCKSSCTSNITCGSGEYCYANAYSCSQEFSGSKKGGVCQTPTGTTKEINGVKMTRSNDSMTWWSAERFCQSLGKQMVSLSDLGCTTTTGTAGCKDSQIVKDLHSAFSSYSIWTSDQKGDNCRAYEVYLYNGSVYTYNRNDPLYALCK